MSGSRVRYISLCADCGLPWREERGMLRCGCKAERTAPEREFGKEVERQRLSDAGFNPTTDNAGDKYYLHRCGHLLHLLSDNLWASDNAPRHCYTLEGYLAWIEALASVA